MSTRTRGGRARTVGFIAAIAVVAGVATAADATTPPDSTESGPATSEAAATEPTSIELTVSAEGIEGLPGDLAAGLIDVTLTGPDGPVELDFTRVDPEADVSTFGDDIIALIQGAPAPDYFWNNSGIVGGQGVTALEEGSYIVWADLSTPDADTTAADIVTAELMVGPGDNDAVVPAGDSNIRAGDYLFALDVVAGGATATFTNTSDNQLHHVLIVDFGANDPAVVDDKLLELLSSDESAPPPEGIDMSQVNFEFGGSGVFGPGSAGTFDLAPLEAGHTYVAVCFISDMEGGMPHALQHQMYEVFTVDA